MRRPNLDRLLKRWQPRLKLADYKISIRYSLAREDAEFGECVGCNYINGEDEASLIVIARDLAIADIEGTVVHELVHIFLDWWHVERGTATYELKERAIRKITDSLLDAWAATKKRKRRNSA